MYSGEYFDKETNTYYLRARYYNPATGRFLSEDPIRDGLNWYTYCLNNPIIFIDPTGLYNNYRQNNMAKYYTDVTDGVFGEEYTKQFTFISPEQLKELGWKSSNFNRDTLWLNKVMTYFGINSNRDSMMMFLATMMIESGYGNKTLEGLNRDGSRVQNKPVETRGAGYLQISDAAHAKFLSFMKDDFSGDNTAEYISGSYAYSMISSGWAWASLTFGHGGSVRLHEYVAINGGTDGVFLVASYFYNGYVTERGFDTNLRIARENNSFIFDSKANTMTLNGEPYRAPNGWNERIEYYNRAKGIWG